MTTEVSIEKMIFKFLHIFQRVMLICIFSVLLIKLLGINGIDINISTQENKDKLYSVLLFEVILQATVIVFSIYLIRKIVERIPFVLQFLTKVYDGFSSTAPMFAELAAISLIYYSSQKSLKDKVGILLKKKIL